MGRVRWVLSEQRLRSSYREARCSLDDKSWLLSSPRWFDERLLWVPEESSAPPPDRPTILKGMEPQENGNFLLEIGVELSDILPTPDIMECSHVLAQRGKMRELAVSNQMHQILIHKDLCVRPEPGFWLVPHGRLDEFLRQQGARTGLCYLALPMKTIVTARYQVTGSDAEHALCNFCNNQLRDFTEAINRLITCLREAIESTAAWVQPYYHTLMFPRGYILVKGKDEQRIEGHLIQLNFIRTLPLRNVPLNESQNQRLCQLLSGNQIIPVYRELIGEARSFLGLGLNREALLRAVFAAEACTTAFVHKRLTQEGVSLGKLEDATQDMPFSRMLNVDIVALCPAGRKPDAQLLGQVNTARKSRNDLAHGRLPAITDEQAAEAVESAHGLIQFLEAIANDNGFRLDPVV
jgi:hypothetical protein